MTSTAVVHSDNSWSPLEEVWLGDVYPADWYSHLDSKVRAVFEQLTEITQQDLASIEQALIEHGVTVRRPTYDNIDHYVDHTGHLIKPSICPRDDYLVTGNTLWTAKNTEPWQHWIDQYRTDSRCTIRVSPKIFINGANVVRVGRDIIVDTDMYQDILPTNYFGDYRVTYVANGGHMDGCFAIVKPGLIVANHYFEDYDRTFPGWEIIYLDRPEFEAAPSRGYSQPYPVYNGKFWNTGVGTNQSFNQHIIDHALDWVGCYTETYFELNCLVINEQTVMMLGHNQELEQQLAQRGVKVHWVPFRTRSFWDGGMHCVTLDIRRRSNVEDFFPERG